MLGSGGKPCAHSEYPVGEGYGLQHAATGDPINPDDHKPVGPILMTAWELQDFEVKTVINHIENDLGYEVLMSQSHPDLFLAVLFCRIGSA